MKPIPRKELYLNKIVGNDDYDIPEKPIIEEEFFFAEILGEAVQAPEPLPRYQIYLAKIAGKDVEIPYPETRLEYFLARAAGMDVETPVPITREEIFWSNYSAIVDFEVEGVPPLTYKAIEGTLENYRIYGNTVGGESVGDLETTGEHAGEYKVPVTVEGKNLLQNTATSQTINGVTFTVDSYGRVTCNGTATAHASLRRDIGKIPVGIYKLSGCPKNGAYNTYRLDIRNSSDVVIQYNSDNVLDTGNGHLFNSTNAHHVEIRIENGYTCNNLTFYPMIRKADITDDTYEPYHAPVTTPIYLPEQIKKVGDEAEYIDYGEQKQHRVRKNLLQNTATSQEINGVTFTVNSDGSVTCNGTASALSILYLSTNYQFIKKGSYILSGCPENGSNVTYCLDLYGNNIPLVRDYGQGETFSIENDGDKATSVRLILFSGAVCDNLTFYPMIRKADIADNTYEPYIADTELDVTLPALLTFSGTNTLSVGTEVQPSKVYVKYKGERQ